MCRDFPSDAAPTTPVTSRTPELTAAPALITSGRSLLVGILCCPLTIRRDIPIRSGQRSRGSSTQAQRAGAGSVPGEVRPQDARGHGGRCYRQIEARMEVRILGPVEV